MQKLLCVLVITTAAVGFLAGAVWSQDRVPVDSLPFSPARQAGATLYVSGQIAVQQDGTPVDGSIAVETRQTMRNIDRILRENGYTFEDVVSVTVYLSDMKHYDAMNAAYREFFPGGNFPARACVGGLQIAYGLNLEIGCIAHKDPGAQVTPLSSHETRPRGIKRDSPI